MTRTTFSALTCLLAWAAAARADVEVAPPPREIRADGTRDPVPQPAAAKQEGPLEIVERIVKNSNEVGEKLASTDAGPVTRKKQDTILKDIDALINRQEDPPPKPDQNPDPNMNNQQKPEDMPTDGMGTGANQPTARKPRQGEQPAGGKEPKDSGMNTAAGHPKKAPTGGTKPKDPGVRQPDAGGDMKKPPVPSLPFDDEVVKDVWGHLPDKLRQQATQYYRQDYASRYADLLKLYYDSLPEKK